MTVEVQAEVRNEKPKVAESFTDSEAGSQFPSDKEAFRTRLAAASNLEPSYEDDPFSAQRAFHTDEDYVDFRSMGWFKAGLIATAENIALGTLSFPSIFLRLGIVGGIVTTVLLGMLAYVTAWMQINFKLRHMGVMHFGDAGGVMFGKWGRRVLGFGMVVKSMGLAGSHVLVGQEALTSISSHAICNVWWGFLITVVSVLLSYNREWHKLWWMSFVSIGAILVASMITIVATGIQSPNVLEKGRAPIQWFATPQNPTLMDVIGGYTNILFAYGGNMAIFSFCSEMKNPNDFKKSFALSQLIATITYIIVGCTIYTFGGQYTVSPALTMTNSPVRITAYSISLITIMVSGILGANVGAKYLYVTFLRNSELLTSKSFKAQMYWMACVAFVWVVGFLVAELLPFFNAILTVVSSCFSVWFICGAAGMLYLYDHSPWFFGRKRDDDEEHPRSMSSWGVKTMIAIAVFTIIMSFATTPLGLYSAIETIIDGYSKGKFKHPFSC